MATVATRKPRVKPERTIRLVVPPSPGNPCFSFAVREGTVEDYYVATPIPADFGTAFALEKGFGVRPGQAPEQPPYHVHLADTDDGPHTCECLGHLRWGHRTRCRHVAGLLKLRAEGKI